MIRSLLEALRPYKVFLLCLNSLSFLKLHLFDRLVPRKLARDRRIIAEVLETTIATTFIRCTVLDDKRAMQSFLAPLDFKTSLPWVRTLYSLVKTKTLVQYSNIQV